MRINNPRLFNGQFLASQNQIADWLGLGLLDAVNGGSGITGQISASLIPISGISIVDGKFPIFGTTVKIDETADAQTIKGYVDGAISGLQAKVDAVKQYSVDEGKAINVTLASGLVDGIITDTFTVAVDYADLRGDVSGQIASELEMVKVSGETSDWASSYALQLNGITLGSEINIPKDQFLDAASYVPSAEVLRLTFKLPKDGSSNVVDIPVGDLVDEYSAGAGIAISDSVSGKNVISVVPGNGITLSGNAVEVAKSSASEEFFFVDANGVGVSGIQTAINTAVSGAKDYADALQYAQIALWDGEEPEGTIPTEKTPLKDTLYYTANGQTFIVKAGETTVHDISQEYIDSGAGITSTSTKLTTGKAVYEFVADSISGKMNLVPGAASGNIATFGADGQVIDSDYAVFAGDLSGAVTAQQIPVATTVKAYVDDKVQEAVVGDVGSVLSNKANKPSGAVVDGNLAGLNAEGNLTDSGVKVATVINDSDAEIATSKAVKAALDSKVNTSSVISGIVEVGADDVSIPSEKAVVDFVKAKTDATVEVVNKKAVEMIEAEVEFGEDTTGSVPGRVIAVYDATDEQVYPTIKYDAATGASKLSTDVADATYTVIYAKRIGQNDGSLPAYATQA